jgi:hypothetical protein
VLAVAFVAADGIFDSSQTYHLRGSGVVMSTATSKGVGIASVKNLAPKYYTSLDAFYKDSADDDDWVTDIDEDYGRFDDDFYFDDDFDNDDDYMYDDDDYFMLFQTGSMANSSWLAAAKDFTLTCALDNLSMMLSAMWLDISILYQAASSRTNPDPPTAFKLSPPSVPVSSKAEQVARYAKYVNAG